MNAKRSWQDRDNPYMFKQYGTWMIGSTTQRTLLSDIFTLAAVEYELGMWQDFDGPILLTDVIKSMSSADWTRNNPAFKGTLLR